MPVYCINLKRSAWRRKVVARQVERMGLKDFSFVEAVDAQDLTLDSVIASGLYDPEECKRWHTRDLTLAEIACSLSHIECYRLFVESGAEWAIVLEDDALFRCSRIRRLRITDIPAWADIVFLHAVTDRTPPLQKLGPMLYSDASYKSSAGAYLLTRSAAQRLLSVATPIRHAADGLLGRSLENKADETHLFRQQGSTITLRGIIVYPELVTNGSVEHYMRTSIR